MSESVIIDTDMGIGEAGADIDDAFAVALAVASSEVRIEAVTTVNGNAPLEPGTRATLRLLERLERPDVPVYVGASRPLRRPLHHRARQARSVNAEQPEPTLTPRPEPAAQAIVEHVLAAPGEITLVPIGPLTNIALALSLEPRLAESVKRIVVMGGVYLGHTNSAGMPGEFNFWVDPDAASIVLGSGAPLELVGLDVTTRVKLSRADAATLRSSGGSFGPYAADCTDAWLDFLATRRGSGETSDSDSCAMHDPLAVAAVFQPDLLSWREAFVQVEACGEVARGVSVADFGGRADSRVPNSRVGVDVNSPEFTDLFLQRIASL